MSDHIPTRDLSVLLDQNPQEAGMAEHLEECAACRREMELLRRMRMALSAMDDREPPAGQWERIEKGLAERGVLPADRGPNAGGETTAPDRSSGVPSSQRERARQTGANLLPEAIPGWLRIAAGVVLFAGGVGLGVGMNADAPGAASSDSASSPSRQATAGPTTAASGRDRAGRVSYRAALEQLEALRADGPSPGEAFQNPEAAAEHLARLDALIRASREALADDPADPAVNDFLFQVVEERQALDQALHLSSLEYR